MFGLGPMEMIIVFWIVLAIPVAAVGYVIYLLRRLVKANEERNALLSNARESQPE